MGQCQSSAASVSCPGDHDSYGKHSTTSVTSVVISSELHKKLVGIPESNDEGEGKLHSSVSPDDHSSRSEMSASSTGRWKDDSPLADDDSWANFETTPRYYRRVSLSLSGNSSTQESTNIDTYLHDEDAEDARPRKFVPQKRRMSIEPEVADAMERDLLAICDNNEDCHLHSSWPDRFRQSKV